MVNKILHRKLKIEIHYNQEMTPSVTSEYFINDNEAMGTCTFVPVSLLTNGWWYNDKNDTMTICNYLLIKFNGSKNNNKTMVTLQKVWKYKIGDQKL